MSRRVTIVDIAHAAGVSKSTVSLVLTGGGKVKAETAEAVRAAMRDLGYVYNRGAASLRNPRSRVVGMVINDLSNPFFAELAIGIERMLRGAGVVPFLANTGESLLRQAEVVRSMREHGAGGIILCPTADSDGREINALAGLGMPVVLAIRRVPGAKVSLVASDNRAGAAAATRHLLGLGHRRIGFIGGLSRMGVRQDRLAGVMEALAAAGVTPDRALSAEAPPTKDGGFDAMSALLDRAERPTAVVCFNDVVAIGAMLALTRRGLAPGDDVAVVGFDDTSEARHVSPALTTVSVGVGDLGERAAQMLLRQIASGSGAVETYIGEARLVVRQSCGPSRTIREVA
ncbi:MAG TPA: LacI family DNA-binding transcriptional regulator [Lichenihabitans sp.]|jgi:LacI family transcriptional regulator|nr:LacI family DNA-binding transcriptional regulator [Lichenihabitans sp.]